MIEGLEDHQCAWRQEAERLQGQLAEFQANQATLHAELAALKRVVFGKKSERMPSVAEARQNLSTEEVHIPVAPSERSCPSCGSDDLKPLGEGEVSFVYEYVPGNFVRQKIVREKLVCSCGDFLVTAEALPKVIDKGH